MARQSTLALGALLVGCAGAADDVAQAEAEARTASPPTEAYTLSMTANIASKVDESFIRREIEAAIDLYRREVDPNATAPISVIVDAPACLRTGYDMPTRTVRFCDNDDTPRAGAASADVIHHELFHALLCQSKPGWCDADAPADAERTAVHEGLADYFSYVLAPDDVFGEGFYADRPYVRRYRVPYCYSLVGGGHEKGNAIASELIERGRGLREVARLLEGEALTVEALFGATPEEPCFGAAAPRVERTITGYPESTLERYRIRRGEPLAVRFDGDDAFDRRYPNLTVRWDPAPELFAITRLDERSFSVDVTGESGYDKVTALYVVDEQVVGGKNFYFQIARPTP